MSPIIWKKMEPQDHERLQVMMSGYLHGSCYVFAIALSRGLGWPLIGLMKEHYDGVTAFKAVWHAGVRDPEGKLWDVRGPMNEDDFGKPFDGMDLPYELKPVTEKELIAVKRVTEGEIESALKKAQALWPYLPWKSDTWISRVAAFAVDLEKISRKHKVWVRGSFPTTLPILAEGMGDEKGYKVEQTEDGVSYTINRAL